MRRRDFIKVIASSAALWPLAAHAQQRIPVIGFLRSTTFADTTHFVTAFRQGLKEAGFIEGGNVAIEFRAAEHRRERLPSLIADLIRRPVAVIVGDTDSARAAKAATTTVPIIFAAGGDPIALSLATSLNRPGGNVTGVSFFSAVLGAKRLELLRALVPKATTIGMLTYPNTPSAVAERRDVQAAALAIGQQLVVLDVGSDREIEMAFATLVQRGASALLVGSGPFLLSRRTLSIALAARHGLPASYVWRDAALAGGLMSYGPSMAEAYRHAGVYAGRILKGERPGDLPVMQSTKFEFVINLKTAKTLGLEFHPQLLATADEVVE